MSSSVIGCSRFCPGPLRKQDRLQSAFDEPWLTAGLPPHALDGLGQEHLTGLLSVLSQQRLHLGLGEIAESQ